MQRPRIIALHFGSAVSYTCCRENKLDRLPRSHRHLVSGHTPEPTHPVSFPRTKRVPWRQKQQTYCRTPLRPTQGVSRQLPGTLGGGKPCRRDRPSSCLRDRFRPFMGGMLPRSAVILCCDAQRKSTLQLGTREAGESHAHSPLHWE